MNAALIAVVLAMLSSIGAYFYGVRVGVDRCEAAAAREERIGALAAGVAASAAAGAISKMKVQHRTVQQEVQREITERVVYRDCQHSAEQLQRINAALTGKARPEPADGGLVPRADAAGRREFWRDDDEAHGGGRPVP